MPLTDAAFADSDGRPDHAALLELGPSLEVVVSPLVDLAQPPTEGHITEGHVTHALVDTGATQSCIDTQVAESLELSVVDYVTLSGAAGPSPHPLFMAKVAIPLLDILEFGAFIGVDLAAGGQPHRVLLGRTFLRSTVMIYDGIRAQVTLASCRFPD